MTAHKERPRDKGIIAMRNQLDKKESLHLGLAFVAGFIVLSLLAVFGF